MKKQHINNTNEPISALIHIIGLLFSIIGFIFLMFFTKEYGTLLHFIGFFVFGISLILLYIVSVAYHSFPKFSRFKKLLRRMDHIMIYIFMASTYTPICLTIDNRNCGWGLFAVSWGFAITGIVVKIADIKIKEWISVMMYVIFGLLILSVIIPVLQWLPKSGIGFLYGGGSFYLIGVIFYVLEDYGLKALKIDFHAIWHLFVIAGSFSHAWLMFKYVLYI